MVAVTPLEIPELDPEAAAAQARLHYVNDDLEGFGRRRCGRGFSYFDPGGELIRDEDVRARLRQLAVPPAWTEVWLCPDPRGHIQATGRDAAGRKQYIYHPRWREVRDRAKFDKLVFFGERLPLVREAIDRDLRRPTLGLERVVAVVVRVLENTLIRIGNRQYRRANGTFGLTTLERRHASLQGATLRLRFRGKGSKEVAVSLRDPRVARAVNRLQELPGQHLFQYVDGSGRAHPVASEQVNDYLRDASGGDFTAKDFRTWAASLEVARALWTPPEDDGANPKTLRSEAIRAAAELLGNTPTVCRTSYIHPAVLEAHERDVLVEAVEEIGAELEPVEGLDDEEAVLLAFLRRQRAG